MARDDSAEFEVLRDEPRKGPKPKVTILTMILIFLNMAAALAFMYLMMMNMQRRQLGAHRTFEPDLIVQGLPLEEEDGGITGSRASLPRIKLSGEEVKAIFKWRLGEAIFKRVPEAFNDVNEPFKHTVRPSMLTKEILANHFGELPDHVRSLEEEIKLQKEAFPKLAAEVAKKAVTDAEGLPDKALRAQVLKAVLPAFGNPFHMDEMIAQVNKASPAELLDILEKGVQRRILLEVLTPMEVFRPGTLDAPEEKFLLSAAGDLEAYPLEKLQKLFADRMDAAIADKHSGELFLGSDFEGQPRGSIEKRQAIGLALVAIAYARGPDEALLDGRAEPRAITVLGLWEFAYSAANYTFCLTLLHMDVLKSYEVDAKGEPVEEDVVIDGVKTKVRKRVPLAVGLQTDVHADREGRNFTEYRVKNWDAVKKDPSLKPELEKLPKKALIPSNSFLARYQETVLELKFLKRELHVVERRLDALRKQNKLAEATLKEREGQLADKIKQLNEARVLTAELADKARELQKQLFEAQVRMVEAAEAIYELEAEIRGVHLPPKKGKSK